MIITVKPQAYQDSEFRFHINQQLSLKGLEHWVKNGTVQFRPPHEYTVIYNRRAAPIKQLLAREFDISPEVFV
jgi:hypothetical protein